MKILQINDNICVNSGVTSVASGWLRNIDKEEIQFDFLITFKRENEYDAEKEGSRVFYMFDPEEKFNPFKLIRGVSAFMKEHGGEYDAVHLHSPTFAFPYLFYAKKYKIKKRVVHAHALTSGSTPLRRLRNFFMLLPIKKLANGFVACSKEAGEYLFKKRGIENYLVLTNGVDIERYRFNQGEREKIRRDLGLTDERAVVHISNMSEIKNVPFVIEVFNKILEKDNSARLFLAGRRELPDDAKSLINQFAIWDKVVNAGVRKDLYNFLSAMDICLLPSISEGLGLAAVECQASGLPVIISDGFPLGVAATSYAKVLPLDLNLWAEESLSFRAANRGEVSGLELFDVRNAAVSIADFYKSLIQDERDI